MSYTAQEINIFINLGVIVVSLFAAPFPIYWLRNHNSDYKDGLCLIAPVLATLTLGNFIFLILYCFRLAHLIDDMELQKFGRLVLLIHLSSPLTLVLSLHNWKRPVDQ